MALKRPRVAASPAAEANHDCRSRTAGGAAAGSAERAARAASEISKRKRTFFSILSLGRRIAAVEPGMTVDTSKNRYSLHLRLAATALVLCWRRSVEGGGRKEEGWKRIIIIPLVASPPKKRKGKVQNQNNCSCSSALEKTVSVLRISERQQGYWLITTSLDTVPRISYFSSLK
jgi:hypothetical protein